MRHRLTVPMLLLLAAACADAEPTAPDTTTAAATSETANAAHEGADESLGAFLDEASGAGGFVSLVNPSPCPSITTSSTNDPVPTSFLRVEFGAAPEALDAWPPAADDPCLKTLTPPWRPDAAKVYLFGTLERSATGTRSLDVERTETLTGVGYVATGSDFTNYHRAERSGTREFSRTTTGIAANEQFTTSRATKAGALTVASTATTDLAWTFTPADGSVIQPGTLRPDGTITVEGTWALAGQVLVPGEGARDVDAQWSVTTVTPLAYDAGCTGRPRTRIASGELRFSRTAGSGAGTFSLRWSGCGVAPEVVR